MGERRSAVRRQPAADETLTAVRLRAGGSLAVVNLSDAGALVEGASRILPGTHVEVHIVTGEGRTLVRSRVVRAAVVDLSADSVRYQAALSFDRRVNTAPSRVAATQYAQAGNNGITPSHEEATC
jgi:hypothetical protein